MIPSDSQAAEPGDRCTQNAPRRKKLIPFALWAAILCLGVLGGFAPPSEAQTASFSYSQSTLPTSGLNAPFGVAVDSSGNVYLADNGNNRVVKETLSAGSYTQSTIASGLSGPGGVAVDASGNVYIADSNNNQVLKETLSGGSYTQSTIASELSGPFGVAVDGSGNVYIADTFNDRVLKETLSGGSYTQSTLASGFTFPYGVAVDGSGNVYVADKLSNSVLKETLSGGSYTQSTIASGLNQPEGVAVDGSGNVYIADNGSNRVLKETLSGGSYTQSAIGSGLSLPFGVAVDGRGNIYVANIGTNRVVELQNAAVNFNTVAVGSASVSQSLFFTFTGGGTLGTSPYAVLTMGAAGLDFQAAVSQPGTACVSTTTYNAGDTCTVDVTFKPTLSGTRYGAVVLYDGSGNVIATAYVYGTGSGPQVTFSPGTQSTLGSGFSSPFGVAVDGIGNIFVADSGNNAVKEILAAGGYTTVNTLGSGFNEPTGVAVDGAGNVFVGDFGNNTVKEILAAGAYTTVNTLGGGFNRLQGVAVDGSGNVFVADSGNNAVKEILAAGGYITVNTLGSFNFPRSVAVDGSGNVFVAEYGNNAVKEILAAGSYTTVLTLGSGFNLPTGVAVDGSGNVFVADYGNRKVKEILAAGGYATVNTLGSGFNQPREVAVDGSGNVFVGDSGNNEVVKLDFSDPPSLSFASTAVGSTSSDSPLTVTMNNIGNTALTFPVPVTGLNPSIASGFTFGNSSTCPQLSSSSSPATLAPGASCTNLISFTPAAAGPVSGSLAITDNHLNAAAPAYITQSIALSGTGTTSTPTISFTVANHSFGDAPFTVSATSNSTGAFTYSLVSGPATIVGSTVTLTGAGSVVLQASEAADVNYAAATQNATFTVATATPTIAFTVANHTFGDAPFTVSAASNSTGAFAYSVVSGPATISGSTVTLTGAGTVVLQASEAADANYAAGTENATFNAATISPTIAFTVPNHTYGDAPFTVSATSNSTGAFAYTVVSGPATIAGSTVTLTGAGTVVLQASEAADSNFAATTKNATFTVAAATPAISFTVANHSYGDAPFTVSATSNSTGAFAYTVVSGPATIAGSTVTLTGAGTVVLQASEAADSNFAATTKNATFTVAAVTPAITFTVPNHTYGDAPFTVSATSNSTGAFTYTVVSGPATIAGSTVTLTGTGTVMLQASQAASGNYAPATANTSFTVAVGFTLSSSPGSGSTSGTATVAPGAAATFTLSFSPGGAATYPDALTLSATGLPAGATATFSPATIAAGSAVTPVTLTIQTSSQTARNEKPSSGGPFAPVALGFLLLPLAGMKSVRRRLRHMPRLTVALAITFLSLGAVMGLSGCGGSSSPGATAKSYAVVVTATDVTTGAHTSANVTLNVQ